MVASPAMRLADSVAVATPPAAVFRFCCACCSEVLAAIAASWALPVQSALGNSGSADGDGGDGVFGAGVVPTISRTPLR